jgi:phosphate transport system permease protein
VILGLGRAVGETMAVTMVIGNRPEISLSLLRPGYTMASVVANEFTEATSDLYLSALIEVGLVLFLVAVLINVLSRLILARSLRPADRPPGMGWLPRLMRPLTDWAPLSKTRSRRKAVDRIVTSLAIVCLGIALVPLVSILFEIVVRGGAALGLDFLTKLPLPAGEAGGGIGNAILGSGIVVGLACAMGVPIGIATGVYLAEYARRGLLGRTVRLLTDVLTEFPSIVIGIFVYVAVVLAMRQFSAFAGAFALAIIMLPIVARTTEESLRLVPNEVREAALALGIPKWKGTLRVTLPAAKGGILTGVMLSVGRIMGETAPLLLTVLGSSFWFAGIDQPVAAMPLVIYSYAISPFPDWHAKAWGGAFVLLVIVLSLNIAVRLAAGGKEWQHKWIRR